MPARRGKPTHGLLGYILDASGARAPGRCWPYHLQQWQCLRQIRPGAVMGGRHGQPARARAAMSARAAN
jgi:hypothetical protein